MTAEELHNIAGFKVQMNDGSEQLVSMQDFASLICEIIGAAAGGGIAAIAETAAAGNDEYEDQLPEQSDFAKVRTLDGSGNPTVVTKQTIASIVGELIGACPIDEITIDHKIDLSIPILKNKILYGYNLNNTTINPPINVSSSYILFATTRFSLIILAEQYGIYSKYASEEWKKIQ